MKFLPIPSIIFHFPRVVAAHIQRSRPRPHAVHRATTAATVTVIIPDAKMHALTLTPWPLLSHTCAFWSLKQLRHHR